MDEPETARFDERFDALVQKIREEPALVNGLRNLESRVAHEAMAGEDPGEIARRHHVESDGTESDSDPGVTGGSG